MGIVVLVERALLVDHRPSSILDKWIRSKCKVVGRECCRRASQLRRLTERWVFDAANETDYVFVLDV